MPLEHSISTEQLSTLIGTADCPTLVDLRIDEDFAADPGLIPTSFRRNFPEAHEWASELPDRPIVLICHKGLKISQGVAALLRCRGHTAAHLIGGKVAWVEENRMTIPADRLPGRVVQEPSRWVTSFEPGVDAIACAWLIRRFIDPQAQFLFVDADQVAAVEDRFSAIAFAAQDGGEAYRSFGSLLRTFTLSSSALDYVERTIARPEDGDGEIVPESAGIRAAITGAAESRATDLGRLEAGIMVIDAFYAWCRSTERRS